MRRIDGTAMNDFAEKIWATSRPLMSLTKMAEVK